MLEGYKISVFIPAGRQRVMSVLLDNLRRFPEIDEVQVWLNLGADQEDDAAWLFSLPEQWDKIRLLRIPEGQTIEVPKQFNTGKFYVNTVDPDTIYFRFDDDIVYIDDGYFANMVRFRLAHPDYFLVMGNIWNNAVISYIHQQAGRIDESAGHVGAPFCMDMVGWQSGPFAAHIHRLLLAHIAAGTTSELHFDQYVLDGRRFSISNFCFFGRDFAAFNGVIPILDEEVWLTEVAQRPCVVCGTGLVSHYSFFAQRPHLDGTDILEQYRAVAKAKLSENYYALLGGS
jgi:hypothetical protein